MADSGIRSPGQHLSPASPRPKRPSYHHHQDSRIVSQARLHSRQRSATPRSTPGKQPLSNVPRIEVHPAQDPYAMNGSSPGGKNLDQTLSRHPQTGRRPLSGLGITTIDFSARSLSATHHSPQSSSSANQALRAPSSIDRPRLSPQPGLQISARDTRCSIASSSEDVRLAYTLSASSIESASNSIHAIPNREKPTQRVGKTRLAPCLRNDGVALGGVQQRNDSTKKEAVGALKSMPESISKDTASQMQRELNLRSDMVKSNFSSVQDQEELIRIPASKRNASSKRLALGVDAIDDSTKSELYALRSLGSASFDSLIAYLEDTVEPGDASKKRYRKSKAEKPAFAPMQTREDTMQLDEGSFRDWVGQLNTSASVLQLTGIQLEKSKPGDQQLLRSRGVTQYAIEAVLPCSDSPNFTKIDESERERRDLNERKVLNDGASGSLLLRESRQRRRNRGVSDRYNDSFLNAVRFLFSLSHGLKHKHSPGPSTDHIFD